MLDMVTRSLIGALICVGLIIVAGVLRFAVLVYRSFRRHLEDEQDNA